MPTPRLAATLLTALAALLALPDPAGAEAGERVWLDLSQPQPEADESGPLGLLEVEGWAGAGTARERDVVLAVDVSSSTLLPAGGDVDGDGQLGRELRSARDPLRSFNPRRWCSDPGDTIRAAELGALRRFVAALDPARTRVGLLAFADTAQLRAPLGATPDELARALDRLEANAGFGGSATDLAAALDAGVSALLRSEAGDGAPRERWLVLLSDGTPAGAGSGRLAEAALRRAAEAAAAAGVRIYAVALGEEVMLGSDVYREIAATTAGRFAHVHQPAEVSARLAAIDLSRVEEVRVENRTTGVPGRALRVSPDGRFDGIVRLAPGPNRIRVTARGPGGSESVEEREVHFQRREAQDLAEARRVAEKLERLKNRTLLLELGAELEHARQQARARLVELQGETPDVAEGR